MAKYDLRIKAREMRSKGESVKDIAKRLGVSKGTISIWVRDIILSVDQLEKLKQKSIKGGELGRLKGCLMQKERRLTAIENGNKWGITNTVSMSDREFFFTGVALYWAEGAKKRSGLMICNSDPELINFMISWWKKFFNVETKRFILRIGINKIHRKREREVKEFWSGITNIPLNQFRKTSFKKSKPHKVYENYSTHYGTLSVKVLKPGQMYYNILGLIKGISRQGSSVG
jgi:transcriptional regulator with XRE-family HTH domain